MVIPIIVTLGTLGALYYTREPVTQLRQGKNYRIYVNVDSALFQAAQPGSREVADTILGFLNTAGFSPVSYRSFRRGDSPTMTTYIYDGTWTRGESFINTPAAPGVNAAFYEKLPLL